MPSRSAGRPFDQVIHFDLPEARFWPTKDVGSSVAISAFIDTNPELVEIVEILECRRATSAGVDFALVNLRLARQSPIPRLVLTK